MWSLLDCCRRKRVIEAIIWPKIDTNKKYLYFTENGAQSNMKLIKYAMGDISDFLSKCEEKGIIAITHCSSTKFNIDNLDSHTYEFLYIEKIDGQQYKAFYYSRKLNKGESYKFIYMSE